MPHNHSVVTEWLSVLRSLLFEIIKWSQRYNFCIVAGMGRILVVAFVVVLKKTKKNC